MMTVLDWTPVPARYRPAPSLGYPRGWNRFPREESLPNNPLFVVSLRNARIHGGFPCVLDSAGAVVLELSRVRGEPIDTHPIYSFAILPTCQRLRGRTLLLASAFGGNFYHWFVDVLPRLELIRRAGVKLEEIDHVLLPEPSGSFATESLQLFPALQGKAETLSNKTQWECDELVCPSLPHFIGGADSWGPEFVRRHVLGRARSQTGSHRLYISRALAGGRRLKNETRLYEKVLAPRGFEFVQPERLRLREQAEMFAAAATVVAPHGAGLTNLIYAPEKCTVIELLAEDHPALCYWHLAHELGLDYRYAIGTSVWSHASSQHRDFAVDEANVAACIADTDL